MTAPDRAGLERKLLRRMSQLNREFTLIEPGDRIMVAISGGKDSWAMLHLLRAFERVVPFAYELIAVNLDQGHPGFPVEVLRGHLEAEGFEYRLIHKDTYSVVQANTAAGKAYCSLCSRLRRGHLYRIAREEGCSALVLGHHREDSLETFFMNLFHGGKLAAMPPKLLNDEGDVEVLRPLIYCAEPDLAKFSEAMAFPIIPCDLCGSQEGLQRNAMKAMLDDIEQRQPGRKDVMIRALGNINASHMLDPKLFDFTNITR